MGFDCRTYICLGKQTLGVHKQKLLCTRTQEKEAVTPEETDPDLLVVSSNLQWRHGLVEACCRVKGTEQNSVCMGPFEGGHHYLHYLYHNLVSGEKKREGTQPCSSTENLNKSLLSMAPPTRTRPSFPHSQSTPSGSFHKPIILIH